MQSKLERFIHDMALRNTMLRAHRQVFIHLVILFLSFIHLFFFLLFIYSFIYSFIGAVHRLMLQLFSVLQGYFFTILLIFLLLNSFIRVFIHL